MSETPEQDAGYHRDETEGERLDRNWSEILQELRVTQAGSQILTGFLLTIPFQAAFAELGDEQRTIYLVLVGLAALCTILSLAPVSLHRALFRQRAKRELVATANVLLRITFVALAVTIAGTTLLIFDVVLGLGAALAAAGASLLLTAGAWFLLPALTRRDRRRG